MMKFRPKRTLNEKSFFLGLDFLDIIALSLSFLTIQTALSEVVPKIVPILIFILMFLGLATIRLKYRRKIIRDFIKYIFTRGFKNV